MMEQDFLKEVEHRGWLIESVNETECVAACPTSGCGLKALLRMGTRIPVRSVPHGPNQDVAVRSYDDARKFLRDRRNALHLSITEVEEASGIASDQLAKCERDNHSKMPNVESFMFWAAALGFEVVLRPVALPPVTLRHIVNSRSKVESREARAALERTRQSG